MSDSHTPADTRGEAAACSLALYAVELLDRGPEPDWHMDRRLFAPWQRYELVVRNSTGGEFARVRGSGNADCWYRIAGELRQTMRG